MLDRRERIFCASVLASKNARIEIEQFNAGWIWISVWETKDGNETFSESIKINLADLRQILSTFKESP